MIGAVEWDFLSAATYSAWVVIGVGAIISRKISKKYTKEKGAKLLENMDSYYASSVVML